MNEQNVLDILTDAAVKKSEANRDALFAAKERAAAQRTAEDEQVEQMLKSWNSK